MAHSEAHFSVSIFQCRRERDVPLTGTNWRLFVLSNRTLPLVAGERVSYCSTSLFCDCLIVFCTTRSEIDVEEGS